jgi:hypothetical protein
MSYIVIGSLDNIVSSSYIILKYSYEYLNNDNSFTSSSNIGYNSGSLLQLVKYININGTNYYNKVANPINLAYRKSTGNCRNNTSDNSD